AACYSTVALGERAAWIDGQGSIAGPDWIDGPILLRPRTPRHGLRAVEELLRSGGFALVVLAGTELAGSAPVRLSRAAREGGAALITLTTHTALSSLRLTSRIDPRGYRWQRTPFDEPAVVRDVTVSVHARAMGWNARSTLLVPVMHHELRLALAPGLVDRRGATRGATTRPV
ncbi:MAG TPA: hypothetical protein VMH39_06915, partial [Gemmatimonadaceae bacterium]|nr:hypothetical protein [Gemmatimonadaceae bacterium]